MDSLTLIVVWLIPGVSAIILHEVAHGWMALRLGDTTARDLGRLSFNPFRHVDLIGTVIVPGIMLLANTPFLFGWAKPVPVNFSRLRGGRLSTLYVALAGPASNALLLLGWLLLQRTLESTADIMPNALLADVAASGVVINLALIVLNLIPLPPLDGSRIVGALLPPRAEGIYMRLDKYGMAILILLIVTGLFDRLYTPVLEYLLSWL